MNKAATASTTVGQADIDAAKAAGWTEEALYDAITVVALFRFYNTWVDAHGVRPMPPEGHEASGKRLKEHGYV